MMILSWFGGISLIMLCVVLKNARAKSGPRARAWHLCPNWCDSYMRMLFCVLRRGCSASLNTSTSCRTKRKSCASFTSRATAAKETTAFTCTISFSHRKISETCESFVSDLATSWSWFLDPCPAFTWVSVQVLSHRRQVLPGRQLQILPWCFEWRDQGAAGEGGTRRLVLTALHTDTDLIKKWSHCNQCCAIT